MIVRHYSIVIIHPGGVRRLFGRISRSDKGDVYVNWTVVESPPKPGVEAWNPHASYHASGQVHSKSHNRIGIKKARQRPGSAFAGTEPLEATNADRGLSNVLPVVAEAFDDTFEIDASLLSGSKMQAITVDLVDTTSVPVRLTGNDTVVAEKVFRDQIPWIVVSLVEPPVTP